MIGKKELVKKLQLQSSIVQSILIDKSKFTKKQAETWVSKHNRKIQKVGITDKYYRFRQMAPSKFIKTSFKTIIIKEGIKAIIGRFKNTPKKLKPDSFIEKINEMAKEVDEFYDKREIILELRDKLILQHAKAHMYKDKKLHEKTVKKLKELGFKHTF